MMNPNVVDCIKKYIEDEYKGGLVKVSDLSIYCGHSQGIMLRNLSLLEEAGEVRIEKRYSCPDFHYMRDSEFPYCSECDDEYPEELINVYFYFKPLLKTEAKP
jgi:hypothetical protein